MMPVAAALLRLLGRTLLVPTLRLLARLALGVALLVSGAACMSSMSLVAALQTPSFRGALGLGSSGVITTPATPTGPVLAAPTPTPVPVSGAAPLPPSDRVEVVIATAMTWLSVPYLWGGCTRRGVDCSCFVMNALAAAGIGAPRVTWLQVHWTTPVSRTELRRGDLVYFNDTCTDCGPNPTHVGLYLGDGQMVQAGGAAVSVQPVFSGFYGQHFASAGRVPGL